MLPLAVWLTMATMATLRLTRSEYAVEVHRNSSSACTWRTPHLAPAQQQQRRGQHARGARHPGHEDLRCSWPAPDLHKGNSPAQRDTAREVPRHDPCLPQTPKRRLMESACVRDAGRPGRARGRPRGRGLRAGRAGRAAGHTHAFFVAGRPAATACPPAASRAPWRVSSESTNNNNNEAPVQAGERAGKTARCARCARCHTRTGTCVFNVEPRRAASRSRTRSGVVESPATAAPQRRSFCRAASRASRALRQACQPPALSMPTYRLQNENGQREEPRPECREGSSPTIHSKKTCGREDLPSTSSECGPPLALQALHDAVQGEITTPGPFEWMKTGLCVCACVSWCRRSARSAGVGANDQPRRSRLSPYPPSECQYVTRDGRQLVFPGREGSGPPSDTGTQAGAVLL